jgi:hypothetical protein
VRQWPASNTPGGWRWALDELRPGVRQRIDALLQGAQPPLETVLTVLVNELVEGSEEVVLVLDDYHLVEAASVHESLAGLLERLPPQLQPGGPAFGPIRPCRWPGCGPAGS